MHPFILICGLALMLTLPCAESTFQVVLSDSDSDETEDDTQTIVIHGVRGAKGEPGECDPWKPSFRSLEKHVERLEKIVDVMPRIFHFVIPSTQMTWDLAKTYCERLHLQMCSYSEIFPNKDNVPFPIGIQQGDHWVPIRDKTNNWAEIGNSHNRNGWRHIEKYGPPPWGLTTVDRTYKGNLFCCVVPQPQ